MSSKHDILIDAAFSQDSITKHETALERLTGENRPQDGDPSSYFAGYSNKVYGMGVSGKKDLILAQDARQATQICKIMHDAAMNDDTYTFNVPSNGVPSYLTTVWTNKAIEQVIQTTPFKEMAHEFQQGYWATSNIKIPTIAWSGAPAVYADQSKAGEANINVNWVDRETIRLQHTITYGDLSVAEFGMAKIDFVARQRESMMKRIALEQNRIGFKGYAGLNVWGLLNDPGLNSTLTAAASAQNPASGQWIYKTFTEIQADVQAMFASIIGIAGGHADINDKCILGVAPAVYTYLTTPNAIGTLSVLMWLELNFKGLRIIQVQDYQGTGSPIGASTPNYAQLVYMEMDGQECVLNAFSSIYNSHGVVRESSYFTEKASYTLSGAIVALPIGVATMSGI